MIMRQRCIESREIICRQLDARKHFHFNSLKISPEFLIDQNIFYYTFHKLLYNIYYMVLLCIERDFMMSLYDAKQADIIDGFNTTSRYLDDILNINNVYFDTIVSRIYFSGLQLNKANTSDTAAAFLDLHLSISNGIVSTNVTTLILKLSVSHF